MSSKCNTNKFLILAFGLLLLGPLSASSETKNAEAWRVFPAANDAYRYEGDALKNAWNELHGVDNEPFPSAENLKSLFERTGADKPGSPYAIVNFNGDYKALAEKVQNAWRLFHRGDFQGAFTASENLGLAGFYIALRARAVHGHYLIEDKEQRKVFIADYFWRQNSLLKDNPIDYTNAYYGVLYALGRYGQTLPIPQAIADGVPFKVSKLISQVEEKDANHPENLSLKGIYHCDVVAKIGGFMSRITFGAKESTCIDSFEKALALEPEDIGIKVEYVLEMLTVDKQKYYNQITMQLDKAMAIEPKDAKAFLDQQVARKLLSEL